MQGRGMTALCAALATALMSLSLVSTASAHLTGDFTVFQNCPWTTPGVEKCIYSKIEAGGFTIGEKGVQLVNPIVLQAGYNDSEGGEPQPVFPAAKGETLSKTPQPIPGGLLALLPSKASPPALKGLLQGFVNSPINRLTSTLELAGPIRFSAAHLAEGEGVAVEIPGKIHLENVLLGKNCYIGSNKNPILFQYTDGMTDPPSPNLPIKGNIGSIKLLNEGSILRATGMELVDNAWSVPKASGCGGLLSFLIDPLINKQMGLPSPAGRNTAVLIGTGWITPTAAMKENDAENP